MRRRLVLVALLLCPLQAVQAQEAAPVKYRPLVEALGKWLDQEIIDKGVPALSWALVDDQEIVFAHGHGFQDPAAKVTATGDTVYRVGSVSKPITALQLMMLVEQGLINLDVPVRTYLPDFRPKNTSGKEITLRQILAHRSGLVREPPVGNYFDATESSLTKTVASLNDTELVYTPESTTSYSNAALAVAGLVLENTQKEGFAKLMKRRLLDPIGMTSSTYAPTGESRKNLAKAIMWTYHGRVFDAPTWGLGTSSAGNLESTVKDQAKLLRFLFAGGKTADGKQLLRPETLQSMYKIQYGKRDEHSGFGISFLVSEFEGKRRIGHGGAVYGFATEFAALPDDKLGVIVIASKDVANGLTKRVSDYALRSMLAISQGKPIPDVGQTTKLPGGLVLDLAGRYRSGEKSIELTESAGRLFITPLKGGMRTEIRQLGKELIIDDAMAYGPKITRDGAKLKIGADSYERTSTLAPQDVPTKWQGLIGEYGHDHNILYILEKDGRLWALIEWVFFYPLEEVSPDVYKFPSHGLYMGDKITFKRDANGRATMADAASVPFPRRTLKGENITYKIDPVRPVSELRLAAEKAKPPAEKSVLFRKPDLMELTTLDTTIKLDIRYATADNFLGTPVYTSAKAFMQRPAALALLRAHKKLEEKGYGLLIHDAYRPWHITKLFYDATPPQFHLFVADPTQGSRHNRGCAVDLTLYDRKTGQAVEMVSGYDEFSDRAYPDYPGGTSKLRFHRELLRQAMEAEGFQVFEAEWWHFDYRDWRQYRIGNERFEELGK